MDGHAFILRINNPFIYPSIQIKLGPVSNKPSLEMIYLWGKVCDVGLLLLQSSLGHKHGEVAVLHAQLLNFPVKEVFDCLPDGVGPRT